MNITNREIPINLLSNISLNQTASKKFYVENLVAKNNEYCPFYKYGQCTIVVAKLAYSVVHHERCKKYWKTCRYYRDHIGVSQKINSNSSRKPRNILLTSFLNHIDREIVITSTSSKKLSSKSKREIEEKFTEVLEMLLEDSQEE